MRNSGTSRPPARSRRTCFAARDSGDTFIESMSGRARPVRPRTRDTSRRRCRSRRGPSRPARSVRGLPDRYWSAVLVCRFARALALDGRASRGSASLLLRDASRGNRHVSGAVVARMNDTTLMIRGQLDADALAHAWQRGRTLTYDEAIALALDEPEPDHVTLPLRHGHLSPAASSARPMPEPGRTSRARDRPGGLPLDAAIM